MMMCAKSDDPEPSEFVEVDPSGRYGRYNEVLGKGASKTVYRAFDEYEGIEVAWNQVKLYDFLQSPDDLERLYCEIHLLKTLKHKNIMKFYTSWVDISNRNINFVTEMFTSGTLRQYRQKHRRVNIRAVKNWCRQILQGLLYLHSRDPPIIHRDLKCDNIFINGNQGEVKIGDLGLAAILRKSHAAHCVGTPEFMAPEVYQEEYNELVDIYSFGMCVLEMLTFEYPYSECTHPAQIYKKVISGTKPEGLYKVKDLEVRKFVEKCLATASERLSAKELLKDPFLLIDEHGSGNWEAEIGEVAYIPVQPYFTPHQSNGSTVANSFHGDHLSSNGFHNDIQQDIDLENVCWDYHDEADIEAHGIDLFNSHEDEQAANVDITIKGRKRDDGGIFLRLRITDKEGRVRNIYFPFDVEADTALSVATEMVAELDITDYDVTRIADMIDGEVSSLVPDWKPGPGIEELTASQTISVCQNCTSNVSSCDSLFECAAMHGRFGEITYQVEGSEQTEGAPMLFTSQSDGLDLSSQESGGSHSDEEINMNQSLENEKVIHMHGNTQNGRSYSNSIKEMSESRDQCTASYMFDDYENEIRQELRWLNTKYQVELRDYRDQQLEGSRILDPTPDSGNRVENGVIALAFQTPSREHHAKQMKSFHLGNNFSFPVPGSKSPPRNKNVANSSGRYCWSSRPNLDSQRTKYYEGSRFNNLEKTCTEKSFCSGLVSETLARSRSLPFDIIDV